jgi:hypothetical protein
MKAKILSVKLGYNPNSSSIGMLVKIFVWGSFLASVFFSVLHLIIKLGKHKNENPL